MFLRQILLIFGILLVVGCAGRPQVELDIVRSELANAYAQGAKLMAPDAYTAATTALHNAETLIAQRKHGQAREQLNQALLHVTKAVSVAQEKTREIEMQRQAEAENRAAAAKKKTARAVKKKPAVVRARPEPVAPRPEIVYLDQVIVSVGETLFSLSSRQDIYGEPLLWPLIYKANRDQIKDPQHIFEGQLFSIPRDKSEAELEAARKGARESDLFPH